MKNIFCIIYNWHTDVYNKFYIDFKEKIIRKSCYYKKIKNDDIYDEYSFNNLDDGLFAFYLVNLFIPIYKNSFYNCISKNYTKEDLFDRLNILDEEIQIKFIKGLIYLINSETNEKNDIKIYNEIIDEFFNENIKKRAEMEYKLKRQ